MRQAPQHSLNQAADTGNLEEVKWLLDHGANVNGTDRPDDDTPLIYAAGRGYAEIARYLVSRGANVNAGREHGRSALAQAICNHFPELAKWLVEQGADVNAKEFGDTPLLYAAHYGNAEIARLLIARGAAVNVRAESSGQRGRTPLCTALVYGASLHKDISVVEALLEGGADPNPGWTDESFFGPAVKTPLEAAGYLKFPELEELLQKHGAK